MTYKQNIIFQGLLEALIPILGFFFWDWNYYFILLFYVLDVLLSLVLTGFKLKKRIEFIGVSESRLGWRKYVLFTLFYISVIVLFGFIIQLTETSFSLSNTIKSFLMQEDMGLPQGLVLLPLMTLSGVMLYRSQFLMQARFRTLSVVQLTQPLLQQALLLLAGSGLYAVVHFYFHLHELIYVLFTVIAVSLYRVFVLRLN